MLWLLVTWCNEDIPRVLDDGYIFFGYSFISAYLSIAIFLKRFIELYPIDLEL